MGFFDKVRDVLTSSDAARDRAAREPATPESAESTQPAAPTPAPEATDAPATAAPATEGAPTVESASTAESAPAGAEPRAARHRTHTVRRGDTLAAIAAEHGVDAEEMARLNGIDNPDLIYPGQVFRLPTR